VLYREGMSTRAKPVRQAQEKKRFFELVDRLATSPDAAEQKRLKEELSRMAFARG